MLKLITVGTVKDRALRAVIGKYLERLERFTKIECITVKKSGYKDPMRVKISEGEAILSKIKDGMLIACDQNGRDYTSEEFAAFLKTNQYKGLVFVIGGAYGLGENVLGRADSRLSLSKMTLQHDLAQLVLVEQLYRALSIIHGMGYHK